MATKRAATEASATHPGYRVELVSRLPMAHQYVAVCACGWRSQRASTAGMVGTAWDLHAAERRP